MLLGIECCALERSAVSRPFQLERAIGSRVTVVQHMIVGGMRFRVRYEQAHVECAHFIRVVTRQGRANHEATMYQSAV